MSRVFCIGNGESRRDYNLQRLRKHGKIYGCNAIYRDFTPDVLCSVDHGMMHEVYHAGVAQKIPCYFRDWTKVPAMHYEMMVFGGMAEIEAKEHLKDILITNARENSTEFVMHGANLKGIVDMIKRDGEKVKTHVNHSTIKVSWIKQPDMSNSLLDIMVEEQDGSSAARSIPTNKTIEQVVKKKPRDHGWSCGPTSGYVAIKRDKPKEIFLIGHDLYSATDKVNNMYKSTKNYVAKENQPTPCVNWIRQWYTLFEWFPEVKFYKVNQFNDGRDATNSPITEWENNKKLPNVEYISHSTLDNMLQV